MRTVLVKPIGGDLEEREISNKHEDLNKLVGGWLECVALPNNIDMWLNEEGLLEGLPLNLVTLVNGKVIHHIVGDVFFAGHDREGETISLNREQIQWVKNSMSKLTTDIFGNIIWGLNIR